MIYQEHPQSVFIELWGKNGNGDTTCWDYFADGTCGSSNIIKNMTYNGSSWSTGNIYPDSIYPEIYFASSNVTWYNQPLSMTIRRNDYHIMHINNPFTMVEDMYMYVEFNAYPVSTVNSADLQVYLVQKGLDITKFNSSWIDTEGVELIGTFSKDATYHHTHTANSSHKLIPLATNPDGTIGTKSLDVSGDFWVVLYSQSPNNARGWSFQYQPTSLCTNTNRWYRGNITGWTTTYQEGCPDAHVHVARRNADYMDGIEMTLTANYETEAAVSEPVSFYFGELPNLPPTATSFTSPSVGGTYSGSIDVTWDPSSDVNNDPISYNVYLKQGETTVATLASATSGTTVSLDTTSYADGNYTLTGEVCDGVNPCVSYSLGGDFTISNTLPIQSISSISIYTSNSSGTYAKDGDIVTLSFTTTGTIPVPNVDIYSGGDSVTGDVTYENESNTWVYTYTVSQSDTNGEITFTINSDTLNSDYYQTTDSSSVVVDTQAPDTPSGSPQAGTYPSTDTPEISLTSQGSSVIRYTLDGSTPSCTSGTVYSTAISISTDTTVKAIACDNAGNISSISSLEYFIKEDLTSISISSNNTNSSWAKEGDIISLTFISSNTISSPSVNLLINDVAVTGEEIITNTEGNTWVCTYTVLDTDENGLVSFEISSNDLYMIFEDTTDNSEVSVDKIGPTQPSVSVASGLYSSPQLVSLSSMGSLYIRYTLDGSTPSCTSGTLYLNPIGISTTTTLKAVGCDQAGNPSLIETVEYLFASTPLVEDEEEEEEDIPAEEEVTSDTQEENTTNQENTEIVTESVVEETDNTGTTSIFIQEEEDINKYVSSVLRRGTKVYLSHLKIKVVDEDGVGIEGVTVNIYSDPKESVTDSEGIAIFEEIGVGEHTVSFKYDNRVYSRDISIDEPSILDSEVELEIITIEVDNISGIGIIKYIIAVFVPISLFLLLFVLRKEKMKEKI